MAKLKRILPPKEGEEAPHPTDEEVLFPERYVRLLDGSTAIIEPWSYVQGREMMSGILSSFVERYNLLDPDKPAFQLFEMAENDLMEMVQLHCGFTDEKLAKMAYEDVLALAEGIWIVCATPILTKSFRLVRSLAGLVPRRISQNGSQSQSSSSSPADIPPTQ